MPNSKRSLFEGLMTSRGVQGLSDSVALKKIADLINLSGDLRRDDGTSRALQWCDALQERALADPDAALLEYFRANALGSRQRHRCQDRAAAWAWEQPELGKQLFHLRRAVNHPGLDKQNPVVRCQILTNLANQMNTAGRFVEAIECWDRALAINPNFGMALGNRGVGLRRYAGALYDHGQRALFLHFANDSLNAALSTRAYYESPRYEKAKSLFAKERAKIEQAIANRLRPSLEDHQTGISEEERHYRLWCLRNRLFLNPISDLGAYSIAACDVLMLPNHVTPIQEPPTLIGFFNQMMQEFVSARWLYYEGVNAEGPHFSDFKVRLYNTLDYPSYGLAIEKVKAAFRIAYSLLDKIGFFLNDYMGLSVKESDVYFRKIWYKNYDKREIRPEFSHSENWPLRGLFWLSKDLFEPELRDVSEPDARALHKIRNHLEHKFLKIHEMPVSHGTDVSSDPWTDRFAYSVYRGDIEAKTLRLLKLIRASLVYLSLGIHNEEKRRRKANGDLVIAPMALDPWEDEWKR